MEKYLLEMAEEDLQGLISHVTEEAEIKSEMVLTKEVEFFYRVSTDLTRAIKLPQFFDKSVAIGNLTSKINHYKKWLKDADEHHRNLVMTLEIKNDQLHSLKKHTKNLGKTLKEKQIKIGNLKGDIRGLNHHAENLTTALQEKQIELDKANEEVIQANSQTIKDDKTIHDLRAEITLLNHLRDTDQTNNPHPLGEMTLPVKVRKINSLMNYFAAELNPEELALFDDIQLKIACLGDMTKNRKEMYNVHVTNFFPVMATSKEDAKRIVELEGTSATVTHVTKVPEETTEFISPNSMPSK